MKGLSLNGRWKFRKEDDDRWMEGRVPGDVYQDLWQNDEIPDPFVETNESRLQWVGKSDWVYEKRFELSDEFLNYERQVLSFEGLDTVAELTVNGRKVGTAKNFHRGYEYRVGDPLVAGENVIKVKFRSPVDYGLDRKKEYKHQLSAHRYPVDQPGREFVRKPQCHYGWDWGPSLLTMGIWRDVELVGFTQPRIRYVTTHQEFEGEDVQLEIRVGIDAPEGGKYKLTIEVAGRKKEEELTLNRGRREIVRGITVENPDLWWPVGYGEQALYRLTVIMGDGAEADRVERRVGFRKLRLVREEDGDGESFYFEVNGTPVFTKGANMIPLDSLPGRLSEARYADLVQNVVSANMNAVRVWGGGMYETDKFFELCDRKGILVWQDFPFACSPYPADGRFIENVKKEVQYQARRLGTHPSLALWCGDNENEWLGEQGSFDTDEVTWEELKSDYQKLNETIRKTINREDPNRPFWPSSPSSNGKADPNEQSIGDSHYWDVWHGGRPFSDYLTTMPRFVSEFGYQSFPSVQSLEGVVDESELNPTSPTMEYRQRHPRGNELIVNRMTDNFRFPFSFEDFVYLSQIQQGLAMKTAIEHWRRLKPYCMGTLYWQLNDVWPAISWSSLEYGGRWKALHYFARRFYAPVLVSTREVDDSLEVWVTSDVRERLKGELKLSVFSLQGEELHTEKSKAEIPDLASEKGRTFGLKKILGGRERENLIAQVSFRGKGYESTNYHFFAPFKSLGLPRPKISRAVREDKVVLRTDKPALFIKLSLKNEELNGRFTRNYFHLVPGYPVEVDFIPAPEERSENLQESDIAVKHIRSTY